MLKIMFRSKAVMDSDPETTAIGLLADSTGDLPGAFGKQITEKFPEVAEQIKAACCSEDREEGNSLGYVVTAKANDGRRFIALVCYGGTGDDPGCIQYQDLHDALYDMRSILAKRYSSTIVFPAFFGCTENGRHKKCDACWSMVCDQIRKTLPERAYFTVEVWGKLRK